MAFAEFDLDLTSNKLGIALAEGVLFPELADVSTPPWLTDSLARGTRLAYISEKSRSEFVVAPILLAVRELTGQQIAVFSGHNLDVDRSRGLMGECDFLLSIGPALPPLRAPIASIVEAKKNDIESGLGQCIAQMYAARLLNQQAGLNNMPMYGCVTTGEAWQFVKLVDQRAILDQKRIYLPNLTQLLATWVNLIQDALSHLAIK